MDGETVDGLVMPGVSIGDVAGAVIEGEIVDGLVMPGDSAGDVDGAVIDGATVDGLVTPGVSVGEIVDGLVISGVICGAVVCGVAARLGSICCRFPGCTWRTVGPPPPSWLRCGGWDFGAGAGRGGCSRNCGAWGRSRGATAAPGANPVCWDCTSRIPCGVCRNATPWVTRR